jgi:hypothetical protein
MGATAHPLKTLVMVAIVVAITGSVARLAIRALRK